MTNKEAIDMLNILKFCYRDADGTEFRMALDLAIKALESPTVVAENATSERPTGEWIPVSERLPDYMEDTLVTIQVNNGEPKVRSGFYARGCFHNDNGDTWNWNDPEVKAWMPLPEAYKEEEK